MRVRRSVSLMDDRRWLTWRAAMTDALYGAGGFYTFSGAPHENFRTASHASTLWSAAILEFAQRIDDALDSPAEFSITDVGAGGGELLIALAAVAPDRWSLHGVDVAPRPEALPDRVSWSPKAATELTGLFIATELLDVVPVDVVERIDGMPRQVEVTSDGDEEIGGLVTGRDAQWLSSWWPLAEDGDRAEIGWPRDDLWRSLTARLVRGVAVAIDYAAEPGHDVAGTMTGYRAGRQVDPVPDGSCDITAHVLFDSLAELGDELLTQREALLWLGLETSRPAYGGDPASYLTELSSAGEVAELLDPDGLGAFTWLIHQKGIDLNLPE
jgi:SAM-dependent MidA family methyltransferase